MKGRETRHNARGQGIVELAVILSLVLLSCLVGLSFLSTGVQNTFWGYGNTVAPVLKSGTYTGWIIGTGDVSTWNITVSGNTFTGTYTDTGAQQPGQVLSGTINGNQVTMTRSGGGWGTQQWTGTYSNGQITGMSSCPTCGWASPGLTIPWQLTVPAPQ